MCFEKSPSTAVIRSPEPAVAGRVQVNVPGTGSKNHVGTSKRRARVPLCHVESLARDTMETGMAPHPAHAARTFVRVRFGTCLFGLQVAAASALPRDYSATRPRAAPTLPPLNFLGVCVLLPSGLKFAEGEMVKEQLQRAMGWVKRAKCAMERSSGVTLNVFKCVFASGQLLRLRRCV